MLVLGLALPGCASRSAAQPSIDKAGNKAAIAKISAMISALPHVTTMDAHWVPNSFTIGPSAQFSVGTDKVTAAQAHAIGLQIEKLVWLSHVAPIESIDIYVGQGETETDDAIHDNLLAAAQTHALEKKYGPRPVPMLPFVM